MQTLYRLPIHGIPYLLAFLMLGQMAQAQEPQDLGEYLRKNQPKALQLEEGLHYFIQENGKGGKPKLGDYLVVEFKGHRLDGVTFDESKEEPFVFQLGHRQVIRGWDRGLQEFPVGTKLRLFLSPQWAYQKTGAGKLVPPDTPVMFDIHILQTLNTQQYDAYMVALEQRERQRYEAMVEERFAADKKAIHDYCLENKIKAKRLSSGISYEITKKGKGGYPKAGETVVIQYYGTLLDGSTFEKNTRKAPFSFEVGAKKVIPGLEEALLFFKKGGMGRVIIPSKLAYGAMPIEEEGVSIPAHSVLVFKLEILDILPAQKKEEEAKD